MAKSTLSLWLQDVPLTLEQQQALARRGTGATTARAAENRAVAARRHAHVHTMARSQITHLNESELFEAGVAAYRAEGSKNGPNKRRDDHRGCLAVYVRRSADLNLQIAGWCEGLPAAAGSTLGAPSGVV